MSENSLKLSRKLVSSVVDHMNTDHADACLDIARAYGPHRDAISATMLMVDACGMEFSIELPQELSDSTHRVAVNAHVHFPKPLKRDSQIRGMLVAMTKSARSLLSG
ncbi:MAG: DUF2470 domain-containing protein [Granulosicoccus sp.]